MSHGGPAEHITPYDRMGLDETTLIALLAAPVPHEGLMEYFGVKLHAELVALARATQRPVPQPGYPGMASSPRRGPPDSGTDSFRRNPR